MTGNLETVGEPSPDASETLQLLLGTVSRLSLARSFAEIQAIVGRSARELLNADGASFVLRDVDECYYVDEDAISPLWKGQRFALEDCISGWAMLNRQAVKIDDIYADSRIPHDAYRPTFVKSMIMVPVRRSDPLAAIGLYWATRHIATEEEVSLAQALADSVAVALEHVRVLEQLAHTVELSSTDPLTGVANRRSWDRALGLAVEKCARLSLGLIDIDHFKRFNDTHGHPAGDEMLRECAVAWTAALREDDLLARYGGEEFGILLRDLDPASALAVAQRVRAATPTEITASIGLAHLRPREHPTDLVGRADAALYEAKRRGRDCIVAAD